MAFPARRSDLLDTYARPYARWMPAVLREYWVQRLALGTAVVTGVGVATQADGLIALGLALVVFTVLWTAWAAMHGIAIVRERTRDWCARNGELARARARRPHRHDSDPELAHDEYVVAVSDSGSLVTFAFTPLAAYEDAAPEAVLITGTPRYEAREVVIVDFDPVDAGRAAEQLADAQDHAARLEAAAIARAHAELDAVASSRELLAETRSTGAALRDLTGQGSD
jgi:hypothetical protein